MRAFFFFFFFFLVLTSNRDFSSNVLLTREQRQGIPLPCGPCFHCWRATTGNSSPLWALLSLLASNDREFLSLVGLAFTVGEQRQGIPLPCGPCFHCWRATTGNSSPLWALLSLLASNDREFLSLVGLAFTVGDQRQGIPLPCGPCFHCWRPTTGNSSPLWALLSLLASNDREFISLVGLAFTVGEQR